MPDDAGTDNAPPYASYLEKFPEDARPIAEEAFKEWDSNVGKKFGEIHSQYEPWKDITSQYDVESVQQALGIADAINNNPQAVWEHMGQVYGLTPQQVAEQAQNSGQGSSDSDDMDLPPQFLEKFQNMEKMVELIGQAYVQQNNSAQEQQQLAAFDNQLNKLEEKHGAYDKQWVLSRIAGGMQPETAVAQYKEFETQIIQQHNQRSAPVIAPAGGGLPSNMPDTKTMPADGVKNLVAQLLLQANQQNG